MANTEQSFGAASTTDDVLEGHDLTGTKVFVTGGNSGLGLETARAMAAKGAKELKAEPTAALAPVCAVLAYPAPCGPRSTAALGARFL